MLIILSFPIIVITFLLIYNYILKIIRLLDTLKHTSLEITLLSFFSVLAYLSFVVFCVNRNIRRLGYNIDLIKLFDFLKESYIVAVTYLDRFAFYVKIYFLLIVILIIIVFVILFFVHLVIISQYIRISFKRLHYLLMNNEIYKKYIVLTEMMYARTHLSKLNSIFSTSIITILFKVLFFLPITLLMLSIFYDIIYNDYILEKYFYICCILPIYYLIVNVINFLTENIDKRADDIVVYAALYCKDCMYISPECQAELKNYRYENNISDRVGSFNLKTNFIDCFRNHTALGMDAYIQHVIRKKKKEKN